MAQKRKRSIAETIELFNLPFALAPAVALIITTFFRRDVHLYVELALIALVLMVNGFILWHRSKREEYKELRPFYTFFTNDLPPPRSGDEQTYNVEIAVIEDRQESYFLNELEKRFKTELDLEELNSLLSKEPKLKHPILKEQRLEQLVEKVNDPNLAFRPVDCTSTALEKSFKTFINKNLVHTTAVVVVRTDGLDARDWVTEAVNSWAYKHSEVPILFVDDPAKVSTRNETAKNFLWMPNDPKSLPWRLLERAKDRAEAWRSQATYNYEMVWNIFYILLMCTLIGVIWIHSKDEQLQTQKGEYDEQLQTQRGEYEVAMKGMDEAVVTEKLYRQYTSLKDDASLSASYWFRHDKRPCIFVTTENPHDTKCLDDSYDTIIGCGFAGYPNHVIEWSAKVNGNGQQARVYDNYGREVRDSKCQMKMLWTSAIKAIACATYNGSSNPAANPGATVGLCVFTVNEKNNIFGENVLHKSYRDFLRERIIKFNEGHTELIKGHKVTPLVKREENGSAAH